jgi:hypothetical protein
MTKRLLKNIKSVEKFSAILNYEISSGVLLLLLNQVWIALPLIIIAALLFTPYMLYIFIAERRFGWIAAFLIIVIVPFILLYFFSKDSYALAAMMLIPFILFYFFCLLVRLAVNQWIKQYNWHSYYEEQKKEIAQRDREG